MKTIAHLRRKTGEIEINTYICCSSSPTHPHSRSDASVPLSRSDFLKWVEKGLKIDLSAADVSLDDLGKALGVWSAATAAEEQERRRQEEDRKRQQESDIKNSRAHEEEIYTREEKN